MDFPDHYFLEDLSVNFSDSPNTTIQLNPYKFFSIALYNAKQLFINFEKILAHLDNSLRLQHDKENGIVVIRKLLTLNETEASVNPKWKQRVMLEIKKYFSHSATYRVLLIPGEFKQMDKLCAQIKQLNSRFSALFFEIKENAVHCYGTVMLLNEKCGELKFLLHNAVIPPSHLPNPTMKDRLR